MLVCGHSTSQLLLVPQGPAAATLTMKVKAVARIVESRKVLMAIHPFA
jgi:hypothetical protein